MSRSTVPRHAPHLSWRSVLFLAAAIAVTVIVVTRLTDARNLLSVLSKGLWLPLALAACIHVLYFVLYAVLYRLGFATVGVRCRVRALVPLVFASLFVNSIVPTGGSGAALFIDDAVRRGESGARTTAGVLLVLIADLITLVPFIVYANLYLLSRNALPSYVLVASILYLFFICCLASALVLARISPALLRRITGWIQRAVNWVAARFRRPDLTGTDWAERNAEGFINASDALVHHPVTLGMTLLWSLFIHLTNLLGLILLFLAFGRLPDLRVVTVGFTLGIVFFIVAIIPQGVGAVEGVMTLTFISLGVPQTVAVAVVLAFRGFNFWLPLFIGFLMLRSVSLFRSPPRVSY